ncbi:group 1 glycosyl transferase [Tolypothrix tenuis PCC 7101]|uniref:Group 1 glycosyl transferase n=1 Tax=Tolypothrix tenuis PCC 7101 TaxID=231146 RepID=A0A1Z4N4F5_9CYAN|nr:glycosyltransferase [Aulosira sp. FACHB-113]BAZ00598.1 group 1 glycosyl transferase [Tolypothrix tenuis PCC 7101]BAZ75480.1 group 1 glycosyl transferase [Aulosira laxa NIES-50]
MTTYINSSTIDSYKKNHQVPIRILHVIGGMVRGGIETWLMHILRHIDRDRFQMDFLVHTTDPCAYDDEIRRLGSQIIPCPLQPWRPWDYAANFRQILREFGPYDIVHSHLHHFSGYTLRLARLSGVPICIAHSHNDISAEHAKSGLYRRWYCSVMKSWIAENATLGLGCSRKAVADLFGSQWQADPRWQLLYYGIDLEPFQNPVDPVAVRSEFNIPADAFVIGHVGRFHPQKNHQFLIEIAAQVARREPKMYLLLLGEGYLQPEILRQVLQMGLGDRVIFAGSRSDIPRLMLGAMDVFLLPSLHEGLPLVLLEAQAAELPCIISDDITQEVDIIQPLIHRLSILQSASEWAETLLAQRKAVFNITSYHALELIKQSPLSIETSVQNLQRMYQTQLACEVMV